MNIKEQRQTLENLLVDGKLDSLSVQVIALNVFANSIGYEAVNGDTRKGFIGYDHDTRNVTHNISLEDMQSCYNRGFRTLRTSAHKVVGDKIVERISLQYNKRTSKKLTSELYLVEFVNEV